MEDGSGRGLVLGVGSALRGAVRSMTWQARVVLGIALVASSGLWWLFAQRRAVGLDGHAGLVVVAASTWMAIALVLVVRRRLGEHLGAVVLTAAAALFVAEGLSYPDASLRWLCLSCFVVVPLVAVMLLRPAGVVVATAVSAAAAVVIAVHLPEPAAVREYVAVTVVVLVLAPTVVTGTLLRQVESARALAAHLACTDELTGLANRRGLQQGLPDLARDAAEGGRLLVLALADADRFKAVNDEHGHQVGDAVLAGLASVLRAQTRPDDLLVRFGGEEIAWVTSAPTAEAARAAAERVRTAVQRWRAPGLPPVTISIGVAVAAPEPGDLARAWDAMIGRADRALYAAKAAGRDRVAVEGDAPPPARSAPLTPGGAPPCAVLPARGA